jgi:hypothetical protein
LSEWYIYIVKARIAFVAIVAAFAAAGCRFVGLEHARAVLDHKHGLKKQAPVGNPYSLAGNAESSGGTKINDASGGAAKLGAEATLNSKMDTPQKGVGGLPGEEKSIASPIHQSEPGDLAPTYGNVKG